MDAATGVDSPLRIQLPRLGNRVMAE